MSRDRDEHECNGNLIDLPGVIHAVAFCCGLSIRDLILLLAAELSRRSNDPTFDPSACLTAIAEHASLEGKNAAALQFVEAVAPSTRPSG